MRARALTPPMEKVLKRYDGYLYAILRIVAGWMFMLHGTAKILGWPGDRSPVDLMTRAGVAGVIELVCGALIMVGLLTSWAAFLSSGLMAFAYFIAHAPSGFYPTVNKGELAVLYCFLWLFVAARGSGPLSIDALRGKARR
jgi:putative oxidoreductase